jgi:hypothetical protein
LKVGRPGEEKTYNGLFAGKIIQTQRLNDSKPYYTSSPSLSLYSYAQNALLCGSAQPHVVTVQHQSLKVKDGLFRLIQTPKLCLNVKLDHDGLLSEAYLNVEAEAPVVWKWFGLNHWSLSCRQDDSSIPAGTFYERVLHDNILLRVQANGSISCSFRKVDSSTRGLVTGDVVVVSILQDAEQVVFETEADLTSVSNPLLSMYQQLVEP